MSQRAPIVEWAQVQYEDLSFEAAREWLDRHPGRKACGHLPVYAPREVIHASGMLPVGIYGGGDMIEIIRGDAFYQSYICHLPRSVIELAQSGRLDFLSAALFPSTCDVIRNLSGMWQVLYPDLYVRYLDLPQIGDPQLATGFWKRELQTLRDHLGEVSGARATDAMLTESIRLFNESRRLTRELYRRRREKPWQVPTEELYLLLRAGEVVPVELYIEKVREYLHAVEADNLPIKDRSRVVVVGSFCEQPPLGLIRTIERSGCYIVDDDFLIGARMMSEDVTESDDALQALAEALVVQGAKTSVLYEPDPDGKKNVMKKLVEDARADGIIFAAPSFCDPALLDRPMLRAGAETADIPCIAFKYSENTGQFQQFREQAGTFADAIKLWGGEAT